ncbi:VQ motif-containing protein 31 [Bienertia sinuspersici]
MQPIPNQKSGKKFTSLSTCDVGTANGSVALRIWGFQIKDCSAFDAPNMETPAKKTMTDLKPLTTFVQADTNTFKDVVQRLTGSSEPAAHEITTAKGNIGVKRPEFKLHERRQYKAKLEIIKPPLSIKQGASFMQQHLPEQQKFSSSASANQVQQISPMSTPTKCFSSLSLVERESKGEPAATDLNTQEEEKAIRERRFYLHPSPRSNPGFSEPELLCLFPLTSPKSGEESNNCQGEHMME